MRRTFTSADVRSAQEAFIVDAQRPDNWKKSGRCASEDTTDIRPERKVLLANMTHLQTSDGLVVSCGFGLSISIGGQWPSMSSHAALSKRQFRRQIVQQTTSSAEASPTAEVDLITQRITEEEDVSSTEVTPAVVVPLGYHHRRVQQEISTEKVPTTEHGCTPTGKPVQIDVEDLSGHLMSMSLLPH